MNTNIVSKILNLPQSFYGWSLKKKLFLFLGVTLSLVLIGIGLGIFSTSSPRPVPTGNTAAKQAATATGMPSGTISSTPSPTIVANNVGYTAPPDQVLLPTAAPNVTPAIALAPIPSSLIGTQAPPNATNPYHYWLYNEPDALEVTVRLVDNATNNATDIGNALYASPGDSAFFSHDFSTLVFIGSSVGDTNLEKISFYSIPQGKIVHQISIDDMRKALPLLNEDTYSYGVLSRMVPSPDGKKIAFSYGITANTSQISPETVIIVIDLTNSKISLLKPRGLMRSWKDNSTITYEINTPLPTSAKNPGYVYHTYDPNPNNIVLQTSITNSEESR